MKREIIDHWGDACISGIRILKNQYELSIWPDQEKFLIVYVKQCGHLCLNAISMIWAPGIKPIYNNQKCCACKNVTKEMGLCKICEGRYENIKQRKR